MIRSITFKLLVFFLVAGASSFGALCVVFLNSSEDFADLAVVGSLKGLSADLEGSFFIDAQGLVVLDDSEIMLKWGFDALYSNLGYRLIAQRNGEEVIRSSNKEVTGALIDAVPLELPEGYLKFGESDFDVFRKVITVGSGVYYLDVVRGDLLGNLANEAVLPAVVDAFVFATAISFLLFIAVSVVALILIVRPVKALSSQVATIQPSELNKRLDITRIPSELKPISNAFNAALDRVEAGFQRQQNFIADAAHELRTPLTILLNRLELSMDSSELKDRLIGDTRYISRIVEQLLDLTRVQNNIVRDLKAIDLVPLIREVTGLLVPLALQRKQIMELDCDVKALIVEGDEGELSLVVKNLLENAIRHTSEGSVIRVHVDNTGFSVEDSGIGIPKSMRDKIFERFWRAKRSDTSGSGLGLAITREILACYCAHIAVEESPQLGGAMFRVSFSTLP